MMFDVRGIGGGQAQCGRDGLQDLLMRPGLGDEVRRPGAHALHGQLNRTPGGDEHDGQGGMSGFDLFEQRDAFFARGLAREVHVLQHERKRVAREHLQSFGRRGGGL